MPWTRLCSGHTGMKFIIWHTTELLFRKNSSESPREWRAFQTALVLQFILWPVRFCDLIWTLKIWSRAAVFNHIWTHYSAVKHTTSVPTSGHRIWRVTENSVTPASLNCQNNGSNASKGFNYAFILHTNTHTLRQTRHPFNKCPFFSLNIMCCFSFKP